jgi:hypothetical protein
LISLKNSKILLSSFFNQIYDYLRTEFELPFASNSSDVVNSVVNRK